MNEELEKEIKRKETEIKDLLRLKDLVGKDLERQIDLRLDDLNMLYKKRS